MQRTRARSITCTHEARLGHERSTPPFGGFRIVSLLLYPFTLLLFPIGLRIFSFVLMLHSRQLQGLGLFGLLLALSLVHMSPPAQGRVEPGGMGLVGVAMVSEPSRRDGDDDDDNDDDDDDDDDDDGDDGPPPPSPPSPPPPPPAPPSSPPSSPTGLSLTGTDAPDPVTAGQPVTYTLMIRNNRARSAKGVTLTDDLPARVTRGAVTTTQGSCGGTDPVGCNLGRIESGAQVTVTVRATPMAPGTITNEAWIAAKNDPNTGNNSVSTTTTVVDVTRTTPLGLENPRAAGCEYVNEEIACPEMASSSSISFDVDIPAGASFIEFDYAFSGADEGDYGTVFLDVPAAVSERTGPSVLRGSAARNNGPSASASPIAVLSPSSAASEGGFQGSGLIPLSNSQIGRRAMMTMSNHPAGQAGSVFLFQRFRTASACPARCFGKRATICGTTGRDHLTGTAGRDVIVGLQGNDTIKGLGGNDLICGGSGRDRLVGGRGSDRLDGGGGNDTLDGGRNEDTCNGAGEADTASRCEKKRGVP
jgi:uncharacterized repeat protein (TIGR01451 family)